MMLWSAVQVRTREASLIRVEIVGPKENGEVDIAWPPDWNLTEARAAVADLTGGVTGTAVVAAFVEPSFERLDVPAWVVSTGTGGSVTSDIARHSDGARSLRLEAPDGVMVTVRQRLPVVGGAVVPMSVQAWPDGLTGEASFSVVSGLDTEPVMVDPRSVTWETLPLTVALPEGTKDAFVELRLIGPGAVNFDDVRVDLGAPAAISRWPRTDHGSVHGYADPLKVPDAATVIATVDRALQNAGGRLGLTLQGYVRLYLTTGQVQSIPSDAAHGFCWQSPTDPYPGSCALEVMVRRAWGNPSNELFRVGLTRLLAGSGVDFDSRVRLHPPPAGFTTTFHGEAELSDAAASFIGWILKNQGAAAIRDGWAAGDLGRWALAGQNIAALEASWRAEIA